MFDELQDSFKEILEAGHSGVLLALCQTCKRLLAKQGSFVQVGCSCTVDYFSLIIMFLENDASVGVL